MLPVVITTNGKRRRLCLFTINSLIDNLKFDGGLFFVVACDRCESDVIYEIGETFRLRGLVDSYRIVSGSEYTETLNGAVKAALEMGDVLFRTEDDYVLEKTLDLTRHVGGIKSNPECGIIKFLGPRRAHLKVFTGIDGMVYELPNVKKDRYTLYTASMYPSLMHKRVFEAIGFYSDSSGPVEEDFCTRFNMQDRMKVMVFSDKPGDRMNDGDLWFVHAGRSSMGHGCPYNRKYDHLQAAGSSISKDTTESAAFGSMHDFFMNSFCLSISNEKYHEFEKIFMDAFGMAPRMFKGYDIVRLGSTANISLGHAAIARMAKAADLPYVCVFEDDAYPCIGASSRLMPLLSKIPEGTRIFYLGWLTIRRVRERTVVDEDIANLKAMIPGFHSYILFRSGYDEFIKRASANIWHHVDLAMSGFAGASIARKPLFIQACGSRSYHGNIGYGGGLVNGRLPRSCWNRTPPDGFAPVLQFE